MADDVILCASELAANAATHSASRLPGGTFTVRIKISPGDYVWVEVEDDGGPMNPEIREATGHHGLDIVCALATDWGIDGDQTTPPSGQDSTGPAAHSRGQNRCPVPCL
jgi:anti-sigma regulatory factor (Ser/Thr protein kinase)